MSALTKLIERIDKIDDDTDDLSKFDEFTPDEIRRVTDAAALVIWKGDEYWMPLSQLRTEGAGGIYASTWILKQKGIEL